MTMNDADPEKACGEPPPELWTGKIPTRNDRPSASSHYTCDLEEHYTSRFRIRLITNKSQVCDSYGCFEKVFMRIFSELLMCAVKNLAFIH